MSEESDSDSDISISTCDIPIESEQDDLPLNLTTDLIDEDNSFIFDEDLCKLICMDSNLNDIPLAIIQEYSLKTKILDLSGNHFHSLLSIEKFINLEELIIDDNQLDDNHLYFPKLSKLHTLMINKNHFQNIFQLVEQLRNAYPMLTYLSLLGNQACPYRILSMNQPSSFTQDYFDEEYKRYRHLVIYRLPTLKFLDSREINFNERRIAMQLGDILYTIAETKTKYTTQISKIKYKEII